MENISIKKWGFRWDWKSIPPVLATMKNIGIAVHFIL
jgi:hypothetical protein